MPTLLAFTALDSVTNLVKEKPEFVVLGIVAVFALTGGQLVSRASRYAAFAGALYFSTLQRFSETPWYSLEMTPFLQFLSTNSRAITIGLLVSSAFAAIVTRKIAWRVTMVPAIWAFLAFEFLNCAKMLSMAEYERFITSVPTFLLIVLAVPFGVGHLIDSYEKCRFALLAVMIAVILVILGTASQLILRPGAVFAGANPRLYATLGHPQKAGMLFALAVPLACYLGLNWRRFWWIKPIAITVAGLSLVGVAASGSRTALMALAVGSLVLFRSKLTTTALAACLVAGIFALVLPRIAGFSEASQRLLITDNTRAAPWSGMLRDFKDYPFFGAPYEGASVAESSFLGTAARLGVVGLLFLTVLLTCVTLLIFKLNRARRLMGPEAPLADLVLGGLAAMGVACIFDQYLFDTVTFFNMYIYLLLTLSAAIIQLNEVAAYQQAMSQGYRVMPFSSGRMTSASRMALEPDGN